MFVKSLIGFCVGLCVFFIEVINVGSGVFDLVDVVIKSELELLKFSDNVGDVLCQCFGRLGNWYVLSECCRRGIFVMSCLFL